MKNLLFLVALGKLKVTPLDDKSILNSSILVLIVAIMMSWQFFIIIGDWRATHCSNFEVIGAIGLD